MAESKRFLLRLNPELFDALRRWADEELRSINAQIEYLLADQARRAGRIPPRRSTPSNDDGASDASSTDAEDEKGGGETATGLRATDESKVSA
jgi:hypothetical protein